jgi:hypothetical protein
MPRETTTKAVVITQFGGSEAHAGSQQMSERVIENSTHPGDTVFELVMSSPSVMCLTTCSLRSCHLIEGECFAALARCTNHHRFVHGEPRFPLQEARRMTTARRGNPSEVGPGSNILIAPGIGDQAGLARPGIAVVQHLPGVGRTNLVHHLSGRCQAGSLWHEGSSDGRCLHQYRESGAPCVVIGKRSAEFICAEHRLLNVVNETPPCPRFAAGPRTLTISRKDPP